MDHRHAETLPDAEWLRLQRWSAGYDEGFTVSRVIGPADFNDCGEYVAGFAQGLKDRRAIDAELPPRG